MLLWLTMIGISSNSSSILIVIIANSPKYLPSLIFICFLFYHLLSFAVVVPVLSVVIKSKVELLYSLQFMMWTALLLHWIAGRLYHKQPQKLHLMTVSTIQKTCTQTGWSILVDTMKTTNTSHCKCLLYMVTNFSSYILLQRHCTIVNFSVPSCENTSW